MYKAFVGAPSPKSIHGPYGENLFRRYLGNLHTDRRQNLWKDRGRRTLSFGVLRIIFRFRFRSTEISKVCTVSHGGETSKIHNSGPDGDSDMRFSPLKSARRAA
jgi:hypothetical protein